ncbi:MAG: DUF3489 domain-containing protein [Rhizomicrobium sp.]
MKLTDSQLVILSAAAKRKDGGILPLSKSVKLNKGAATLVLKSLLKHKLIAEKPAGLEAEGWREGRDGQRFALSVTPAGLKAIGVEELPERDTEESPASTNAKPARQTASSKMLPAAARKGTKLSVLVDLLSRKTGATIEEAGKATGWQHHSVRGAISGALKKKMGLKVTSSASDRGRIYRIGAAI